MLLVDLAVLDPACDGEPPQLGAPPHCPAQAREGFEHEGVLAPCEAPLDLVRGRVGVWGRARVGVWGRARARARVRVRAGG